MQEIKVFLAHTSEVKDDIDQIRIAIDSKYQESKEYRIIIKHWSDADKGLSQDRFQQRLNEVIGTCEILYIFFQNRVGEYTKEEFYYGLERFKKYQKPYNMSLFFKDFHTSNKAPKQERIEANNTIDFQDEVREINGNQHTFDYTNIADLKNQLLAQLEIDLKKPIPQKLIPTILDELFPKEEKTAIYLKENVVIPRRDENFVGREAEIQLTLKYLINKKQYAITGVIGNGGVGKSAIANEIIHIIQDSWRGKPSDYLKEKVFVDGIMWIKLEQEQTLELVFEEQIIKQLGVKLSLKNFDMELHKLLLGRDILIVLDSAEQNQPIFNELMKLFNNYPILITSRKKYAGIKMLELDTLYAKESFDLFQNHLDQPIPKEEEESITKFCVETLGGLPLAIKIIANYMKESRRKLSEVKQNLLDIKIDDPFREETVSVDSVFELSYSTLTPNAQKVFAMGSVFIYPFKEVYLLEIAKKNEETSSITQEIDSLMKISLIERNGDLYSYHPLLREYALKKLYSFAFSEAIFEAYKGHHVYLSANEANLPIIYDELLFILEDDYRKENYERFFKIIKNLDWWLVGVGFYARRENLLFKGYQKAQTLEDKKNEYIFLRSYADTLYRKGKTEEAKRYFQKALKFEEGKEDFWLHYSLGAMEYDLKNYQDSYTKNLEFSRKALIKDNTNYSSFLKTNSWICTDYYQFNLGIDYAKINSLVQGTRSNNFKALNDLIKVYFYQANYEKSLDFIKVLENYFYDINFDIEDKIELKILKSWIYLYTNNHSLLNEIKYVENSFNLLEFGDNVYDTLRGIKMFFHIQKTDFEQAKRSLEKIRDKEEKNLALGIYNSYTDISKAEELLKTYLKQENPSPKELATAKLYLAKVYTKKEKIEEAVKLLCEAQYIFQSYMNPIEKKIEKEILECVGIDKFIEIKSNTPREKIENASFLENLPKSVEAKDGKKMILIPQGFSIYGEDNFSIPTIDEIFEDVEMVLENNKKLQRIRYLGNFYIDKEAVTNEEYIAYCQESGKEIPSNLANLQPNESVKNLTLQKMQEYAEFYGKVLPLPEEWEKACRGEENFNYPWGNEWDENIEIDIGKEDFKDLKNLFVDYNCFEEYVEWYHTYQNDNEREEVDLGVLNHINFNKRIEVDKYFFFKILFNSLSLNTIEKFRVIDAISTLSQFQVDEFTKIFTEEVEKFIELSKEHPDDIVKLFGRMKEQALDIIGELTLKKSDYITSISPYGIKNMVGNGYEVAYKNRRENIIFKGSIITYDYKEKLKAKTEWSDKDKNIPLRNATFRCVKPIFSLEDLQG